MERLFSTILFCILLMANVWAQAPQQFSYQAVARDNAGAILKNQPIGLRITIEDNNGNALYTETHRATTNNYGLFVLSVGGGTPLSGTLAGVGWTGGDRYIKVDVDAAGGTNYAHAGTSQLLSVPYALYAETSGSGSSLPTATSGSTLRHNGASWLADSSIFSNGTFVGIGTSRNIGQSKLVVSSNARTGYGGMYVNTTGTSANPFYGYATGATSRHGRILRAVPMLGISTRATLTGLP